MVQHSCFKALWPDYLGPLCLLKQLLKTLGIGNEVKAALFLEESPPGELLKALAHGDAGHPQ